MENKTVFNLKVLYVEDESDTMEPMKRFLERRFSAVATAADGEDGWKKFNDIQPDLVITDLLMPEFSGVELIKRIRETGYAKPIIITSALQDVETIVRTVDYGINKYIIKPVNLSELDHMLEKLGQEAQEHRRKHFSMSFSEKKDCEAKLRLLISNLIKQYTGKGPKDVKVLIGSDRIQARCINVRTVLENTLYQNGNNIALIEQNRRLLYQILKTALEECVSEAVGSPVRLSEIEIDSKTDSEKITFQSSAG